MVRTLPAGDSQALLALLALLAASGCNAGDSGTVDGAGRDSGVDGPANEGEGEGLAKSDGWPELAAIHFTAAEQQMPALPESLRLASDGERVALAYLLGGAETGNCNLGHGATGFPLRRYEVHYRPLRPSGSGDDQVAATSDVSFGLGFALLPDGAAQLAFLGGETGSQFCGGSDLMLASGPPWQVQTLQAGSATGASCRKMQDVCNQGDVTGLWATIAVRGSNRLLAFQDIHFGFTKEDWDSSDLEVATGSSWNVTTADDSQGGGADSAAAIGEDGTLAVATYNPVLGGLWLSTLIPGDPQGWRTVEVDPHSTTSMLSLAARPGGGFGIAFYEPQDKVLLLTEATSAQGPWQVLPVDERATTGLLPQLAYTSAGRAVIAYRQCHRETGQSQCDAQYDGVWLAVRAPGSSRWDRREMANEPQATEGESLAMVLPGGDGLPVIALTRTRPDPVSHQLQRALVVLEGEQ